MDWKESKEEENTYYCEEYFNGDKYVVEIWVEFMSKSLRFWVAASSGRKRKDLLIFDEKLKKSKGGIKALLWVKRALLDFPSYYDILYNFRDFKQYICINWTDAKRRDVYGRLEKEGFRFMPIAGEKILIKTVHNGT